MVVMLGRRLFIARAAVAEIVALEDAGLLEQAHGAVDGGDRDLWIDRGGALVHRFDVRMIGRFRQHTRDDATLFGHLETFVDAELFDTGRHSRRCPRLLPEGGNYSPNPAASL